MLPHDELYHYGVKGMKWGVRKTRKAARLSKKSAKLSDRYRKNKVSGSSAKTAFEKKARNAEAAGQKRKARMYRDQARAMDAALNVDHETHQKKQAKIEKKRQVLNMPPSERNKIRLARITRAVNRVTNLRLPGVDKDSRSINAYEKAYIAFGGAVLGAVGVSIARPAATYVGQSIASRLVDRAAAKVVEQTIFDLA